MARTPKTSPKKTRAKIDGAAAIAAVLEATAAEVSEAERKREEENEERRRAGQRVRPFKPDLSFAIAFARHMGRKIADALVDTFPDIRSGEIPSTSARGSKRLDVRFSTPEMGLGLGISLKSVHRGEGDGGNAKFTHNKKRNDEELRVEATSHHLRQPYAVLVAVLFLPFESCTDRRTSSFADWVAYLWPLKGRTEPEDPPDRFELVFIALYERSGTALGIYEVGGSVGCPRTGRPKTLLTFDEFLDRLTATYNKRNGRDFFFEGEGPNS